MKLSLTALIFISVHMSACSQNINNKTETNNIKEYVKESPQWWYQQGQLKVRQLAESNKYPPKAKNVILFIGDGMNISTITAARILEGQEKGVTGEENILSFEGFPYTALSKTYNTNLQTPDSAGTMSAMMTGVKTKGGVISVNGNVKKGRCNSAKNNSVMTLLELAEQNNMSTGVVSTARLTHATPAATYSHSVSRGWESDSDIPESETSEDCKDIASQLIDFSYGDGIEVAMGGGRLNFLPKTLQDPEYQTKTGKRRDDRNLMQEWEKKYPQSEVVWNQKQFDEIDVKKTSHLLGLFEPSHMQYERDRVKDKSGEPSLSDMTLKSLQILKNSKKHFFLMVEAGRIDHSHHAGNAYRALTDTIELSNAVRTAVENVDLNETMIIVTADHSHTFNISGYPQRGNPILGLVRNPDDEGELAGNLAKDGQNMPYTTLSYANGPGYINGDKRPDLTHVDVTAHDYKQAAAIPMYSETHSGEDVTIYATGAGSQLIHGTIEQNVIYHIMRHVLGL